MYFEGLTPIAVLCPNCGLKCMGYRARDEMVRLSCRRCGLVMVSKIINKRTIIMRMTAPPGQTLL